jgi:hypothetical protein
MLGQNVLESYGGQEKRMAALGESLVLLHDFLQHMKFD